VINILKGWLKKHGSDFVDSAGLGERLQQFLDDILPKRNVAAAYRTCLCSSMGFCVCVDVFFALCFVCVCSLFCFVFCMCVCVCVCVCACVCATFLVFVGVRSNDPGVGVHLCVLPGKSICSGDLACLSHSTVYLSPLPRCFCRFGYLARQVHECETQGKQNRVAVAVRHTTPETQVASCSRHDQHSLRASGGVSSSIHVGAPATLLLDTCSRALESGTMVSWWWESS
jgi:hypothetical protein